MKPTIEQLEDRLKTLRSGTMCSTCGRRSDIVYACDCEPSLKRLIEHYSLFVTATDALIDAYREEVAALRQRAEKEWSGSLKR